MSARIVSADESGIAEAAERLRSGGIVAIPTETVYGLAANALDPVAVAKIYAAKGRPATNPLIVHVADEAAARELAAAWPDAAARLAARFWPGPLTLVVPKAAHIPDIVTAGGATVGLRVPSHPVALEILRLSGVPLAAPSANRSEEVSPTTAQHVADSLGDYVEDLLIVDGGACEIGIESTVVDVTGDAPRVLRPGMAVIETAESAAKQVLHEQTAENAEEPEIARSPGRRARHYAPAKPLTLIKSLDLLDEIPDAYVFLFFGEWRGRGRLLNRLAGGGRTYTFMPTEPKEYAAQLYSFLRGWDAHEYIKGIILELPPDTQEWAAIHDRLRRAATKKTENET